MTDEGDLRERAIASLKKKREFAAHLLAYVRRWTPEIQGPACGPPLGNVSGC